MPAFGRLEGGDLGPTWRRTPPPGWRAGHPGPSGHAAPALAQSGRCRDSGPGCSTRAPPGPGAPRRCDRPQHDGADPRGAPGPPRRAREARARVAAPLSPPGTRGAPPPGRSPNPADPSPCRSCGPAPLTLFGFLPPDQSPSEFPQEGVIFLPGWGRLGGGGLGDRGRLLRGGGHGGGADSRGPVGTRSWRWAGAAGLRLRLSKRKRNYSKHLRQLTLAFPFPLSLPRAALRPARSCALGPSLQAGLLSAPFGCPKPGGCPTSAPGRMCSLIYGCVSDPPAWDRWSLKASFPLHPARILAQTTVQ